MNVLLVLMCAVSWNVLRYKPWCNRPVGQIPEYLEPLLKKGDASCFIVVADISWVYVSV